MQVLLSFEVILVTLQFVTDRQSVKSVRKLIHVNQKRPHEKFVNKKSSCLHDFEK